MAQRWFVHVRQVLMRFGRERDDTRGVTSREPRARSRVRRRAMLRLVGGAILGALPLAARRAWAQVAVQPAPARLVPAAPTL